MYKRSEYEILYVYIKYIMSQYQGKIILGTYEMYNFVEVSF